MVTSSSFIAGNANDGDKDWTVPDIEFDAAVDVCFDRFKVVGFYADPSGWQSKLGAWDQKYGSKLQVKAVGTMPHSRFYSAIWGLLTDLHTGSSGGIPPGVEDVLCQAVVVPVGEIAAVDCFLEGGEALNLPNPPRPTAMSSFVHLALGRCRS
jgi:hypothetical protein